MKPLSRRNLLKTGLAATGLGYFNHSILAQAISEAPGESGEIAYDLLNLFDYEEVARYKIVEPVYEYIAGGAADEITLRWNRESYDHIKLLPRFLKDVSIIDSSITLFGRRLEHPVLLAPTALHGAVHPEGELETMRGANLGKTVFVLATGASRAVEDVAREGSEPLWFQLYVQADRQFNRDLIARVEEAGCGALVVTVDSPADGVRNRQKRSRFSEFIAGMPKPNQDGLTGRPRHIPDEVKPVKLTWKEIDDFKAHTKLPFLLKGILHPEDAVEAVKRGIDGIIVSNHGARFLDTVPATIEALPKVLDHVEGRIPVLVDGGIRRGTDVLKAMAYGAAAVLIGRPYLYGLGVSGAEGVSHVLDILVHKLRMAMALTGRPNISSLDRSVFWKE
jgi:4-hydroxymandelate oxidase